MWEDKRIIYIVAAIIGVVLIVGLAVGILIYLQRQSGSTPPPPGNPPLANTNGTLPPAQDPSGNGNGDKTPAELALEKEKQFISAYFKTIDLDYQAATPAYQLPINNIKETAINFRDFSRRVDIESELEQLATNGFLVIDNIFTGQPADWQTAFSVLKDQQLPVLITADGVTGLYQDTLDIIYKEIEPERFYPSLWRLMREMQGQVKQRYESRRQVFGIETDSITEANRLELAYLTIALRLLQPDANQVRESIGGDRTYFTPQEKIEYTFTAPAYLRDEVEAELQLIINRPQTARSPLFLYEQSYTQYQIPPQYQVSEKLKNYYLTITWLQDKHFPLFNQSNNCPGCLLDEQDHTINFLAGLYLTRDLASNQDFENRWANIFKSIAFFRGLEADLTYLDYQLALEELYGPNYNLDEIFQTNLATVKQNITTIQDRVAQFNFLDILGGKANHPQGQDLRLLRDYYVLENKIFDSLSQQAAGEYLFTTPNRRDPTPPTACSTQAGFLRCWPSGLDVLNALENQTARNILTATNNDRYPNYQQNLQNIINQINQFDQRTWHDNSYLSLLASLQELNPRRLNGFPTFMQTQAWRNKTLNTELAAWTNTHRSLIMEKISVENVRGLEPYFPYGYIEPQPEFYAQLLATVRMLKDGLTTLQIIDPADRPFHRLEALETILDRILRLSQMELENQPLSPDDFDFINNFAKQIKTVTGDLAPQRLRNNVNFQYDLPERRRLNEQINGLKYLIVVYPNQEGKLVLAIGPIFSYAEVYNGRKVEFDWQNELNL